VPAQTGKLRVTYRIHRAVLIQLLEDALPPLAVMPMTTDGKAARVADGIRLGRLF